MTFLQKHHGQMSDSMLTAFFIILSGGLQDAYTYCCRGKVFANAQTGNIVLLSTHLFEGDWGQALRYLVPVLAFLLGIYIAECVHRHFKRMEKVHWRQLIILAEIVLLAAVGFLPDDSSHRTLRPAEVAADGITAAGGGTYAISSGTRVLLDGAVSTYGDCWYELEGREQVTLY